MAFISFDALVPGKKVTVYSDQRLDAVELSIVMTGKNRDGAGKKLRDLKPDIFNPAKFAELKLPGEGNRKTKTVHFKDAIELVMVLPGKVAKEMRCKFAEIITRYFAGDATLLPEIQANAESSHPVAELARDALKEPEAVGEKRKISDDLNDAEALVKRLRDTKDTLVEARPIVVDLADFSQRMFESLDMAADRMRTIVSFKREMWQVDEEGRAKEMHDEEKKRTKELEHIKSVALAQAEAMQIVAKAKADTERLTPPASAPAGIPQAIPASKPAVADFIPADHTTVTQTYEKTYPKYKPNLKKDEKKFLNDVSIRARRTYESENNGMRPQKVREGPGLVDMYPTSWQGIINAFAEKLREFNGYGQKSMHSFVHHTHVHRVE